MVGVRVVQPLQVPAAVGRQSRHRVAALVDQPPQRIRRVDPARVAATHAHQHDRVVLVGRPRPGNHLRLDLLAEELAEQVVGESGRGRVVEHHRRGQPQPGDGGELVAQLHGGQRVETQVLELAFRFDLLATGVPEHGRDPAAHQLQHGVLPVLLRQRGQALEQGVGGLRPGGLPAGAGADEAAQQRGYLAAGAHGGQVQLGGHDDRPAGGDRGVEQPEPVGDRQRRHAHAGHAFGFDGREHAFLLPRAPGQRHRGQALGVPVAGQRVEEDVARGVVGLPGVAESTGGRGEQDERGELPGQLVQVPRGVDLGSQHGVQALRGERVDHAVVEHTGGVHDRPHLVLGEQFRQRSPVGDVAGGDLHAGAQLGELGRQLACVTAAAHQQQVTHAVRGDQVPCDERAQAAGGAGDQHGAVPGDGRRCRFGAGEARGPRLTLVQQQLRFVRSQRLRQRGEGRFSGIDLHQAEAAGVLGLRGAHQPPRGRGGELSRPRDEHDLLGPVALDQLQRALGRRVRRPGDVVTTHDRHDEDVGVLWIDPAQAEHVLAEHGEGRGLTGGRDRDRVDAEQGVAVHTGRGRCTGCGPHDQGVHREQRRPSTVGRHDRHGAVVGQLQAHPQRGGAGGVQRHAFPRERHARLAQPGELRGVQRGVQQRRVQAELGRLDVFGQLDLGEHDAVRTAPGGAQSAERRAVLEAPLREALVAALDVQELGACRRPGVGVERSRGLPHRQGAASVLGPRLLVLALGPRVDRHRPPALGVGLADPQLHLHTAPLGQHQGRGEGELVDSIAADLVTGADREFHERGARQQHRAVDRVIHQPRVRLPRQPPGEQHPVGVGERHGGRQQRVLRAAEPGRPRVVEAERAALGPESLSLEGVGGQVDAAGTRSCEALGPVHPDAAHVHARQGGGQGVDLRPAGPQRGHGDGVHALLRHRREHAVRAEFEERGDAVLVHPAHGVGEAHGPAHLVDPVVGGGDLLQPHLLAGHRRHQRDLRGFHRDLRQHRAEVVQRGFHQRRVEGVRDVQPAGLAPFGGESGLDGGDRVLGARDHERVGAVDRGDRGLGGEVRQHVGFRRGDGQHRPARRQRLDEAAARGDELRGVLQREDPRDVRGADLADRVPGDEIGFDPP
ncbi:hypothetical protein GCM10027597_47040 [Saccharopolyspora tripterygii]